MRNREIFEEFFAKGGFLSVQKNPYSGQKLIVFEVIVENWPFQLEKWPNFQ